MQYVLLMNNCRRNVRKHLSLAIYDEFIYNHWVNATAENCVPHCVSISYYTRPFKVFYISVTDESL